MLLKVNGDSVEIDDGSNMGELLDMLEIPKTKVAVELNGVVIPNSELLDKVLKDQDILEIVRAIGGG
jgi:thiamine biosynthesis protein ThiS